MENGYKVLWTDHALDELQSTFEYLESNFTHVELKSLSKEIEKTVYLISKNPFLFPESQFKSGIRKVGVAKYNTMYYRLNNDTIEILSFFSNRQHPSRIKL